MEFTCKHQISECEYTLSTALAEQDGWQRIHCTPAHCDDEEKGPPPRNDHGDSGAWLAALSSILSGMTPLGFSGNRK